MSLIEQIDIDKAKELIDQGGVTIVDVRDPDKYEVSHIAGAVSITDESVEEFLTTTDKTIPVICYCNHGIASREAADVLGEKGFETVYSMKGGFEEWRVVHPVTEE